MNSPFQVAVQKVRIGERRGRDTGAWPGALALALALLLSAWTATAQAGQALVQAGYGGGGRFTAFAINPADPARVVVGSDVAGYFVSGPDGRFVPRGKELDGLAVSALAFHPQQPGVLAVQGDGGLYLSRDRGQTLTRLSDKLGYGARFFGSRLLLFNGPTLYVATDGKGVFAVKWESPGVPETALPGLEGVKVNALAWWDNTLYAATEKGVFRLKDNRFAPADQGLTPGSHVADIAAEPKAGLFAVVREEGLKRFDAAKNAWAQTGPAPAEQGPKPIAFKALALDPAKPGHLLMATDPEYWPHCLFASEDNGATWKQETAFTLAADAPPNWAKGLEAVEAIAFAPDGRTVYLADWWNVWRSDDGGATFAQLLKGLQNTVVNGLDSHPAHPETILMATADNGIMRSTDAGATWARSMAGVGDGDAMAVRFAQSDPNKAYFLFLPWDKPAAKDTVVIHLCKSLDAGASWQDLTFSVPTKKLPPQADGKPSALRVGPRNEDQVYVGTNGHGLFRVDTALLAEGKAREAVENLSTLLPTPNLATADSLLVDPANPVRLYASTVGGGVWTSENAGRTWLPGQLRWTYTFGLAADPSKPGRVLAAASEKRVIATEDGGRTWKETILPGPRPGYVAARIIAVDPARPEIVTVGTSAYDLKAADGLYVSRDGGKTFVQVPSNLPRANNLCLLPRPDGTLIGTNGLGLLKLVDTP